MEKSFSAYVFQLHRIIPVALSLIGIIIDVRNKIFWLVFIGSLFRLILRMLSYFADRKLLENKGRKTRDGSAS